MDDLYRMLGESEAEFERFIAERYPEQNPLDTRQQENGK